MTLQHLRSSTANKRPVPGSMADGQLGVNLEATSPGVFFKDSAGNLVKVGPVHVGTTAPNVSPAGQSGNSTGEQWLDTTGGTYNLKIWDGSAWRSEAGEFVNVTGDTMTGALAIIAGSASAPGLAISGDSNTGIYSPGADQLALTTGGTQRLGIDSSGNINSSGPLVATASNFALRASNGSGSGQTSIALTRIGAPTDQKTWEIITRDNGRLNIRTINDTYTGSQDAITIERSSGFGVDNIQLSTTGSERARIDSSGRLLVGTSSARANFLNSVFGAFIQVEGTGQSASSLSLVRNTTDTALSSTLILGTSNGTTVGSNVLVASNANCGTISYQGNDGTEFVECATISAAVDGTPGANDMPGRLVFSTTADGTASPTERLRITSAGLVGVGTSSPGTIGGGATVSIAPTGGGRVVIASPNRYFYITGASGTEDLRIGRRITSDTADNDIFTINGSTGNVGIGTTSPGASLDVSGNIRLSAASPNIEFNNGGAMVYGPSANTVAFATGGGPASPAERARIDSSGKLLVGTSSTRNVGAVAHPIQNETPSGTIAGLSIVRNSADGAEGRITFGKTRSTTVGGTTSVASGDFLGTLAFAGANGTDLNNVAATISVVVDGDPTGSTTDLPGRIVFSTTPDGTASSTERFRITNDGVIAYDQPAPAAVNATATLTIANLKAGIITSTSALATDMTLPTGTDTQAGFSGTYDNFTFEWSVINTGPSLVRMLAGTAHTVVGSGSVLTGTSGRFASRRTAANTFVTYRLA